MEKAPSARNTENPAQISPAATSPGKPSISRAQYNLQQEYYEAQNALLESYRKAQKALVKTYVRKQKMATDSKLVPVEADVIQNAQREAQATIEGVIGTKGSDGTKPIETETTTIPAVQDQPKSVYAFTDEVQKIKCMHENLTLKEDEIDRAEYVFMQPIYANTYGAQTGSRDVVEKYVMNMLPEQYFDRAMDDGAVYVAQTKSKENLDSAEKPQAASPMPKVTIVHFNYLNYIILSNSILVRIV
uniref:Uncharacterized protein n=1 Tax=Setaria digitata TaxID=48799 RepID=A0A915PG46_9BILA